MFGRLMAKRQQAEDGSVQDVARKQRSPDRKASKRNEEDDELAGKEEEDKSLKERQP